MDLELKVRGKGSGIKGKGEKDLELKVRGNGPGIKGKEKDLNLKERRKPKI